jgi:hypothetical protein
LTASIAMIHIVIKKRKKKEKENLLGNETRVGRTVSKHATTWATADIERMWQFTIIWSNSEGSGK